MSNKRLNNMAKKYMGSAELYVCSTKEIGQIFLSRNCELGRSKGNVSKAAQWVINRKCNAWAKNLIRAYKAFLECSSMSNFVMYKFLLSITATHIIEISDKFPEHQFMDMLYFYAKALNALAIMLIGKQDEDYKEITYTDLLNIFFNENKIPVDPHDQIVGLVFDWESLRLKYFE